MPLFTDGLISCIEDLTAQDSQLLDVASVERIDTTKKMWIAQEEVAMDLIVALQRLAASTQPTTTQIKLDMVVVTPPLKLWHTAHSLELVYSDAYFSQLNDRYAEKRDQFNELARWAFTKLMEIGVGVTTTPVARARIPILTPFPGALPDGVYYVTMDWVDQTGDRGAPAEATTIATTDSTFLVEPAAAPPNAVGWDVYVGVSSDTMYQQNSVLLAIGQTWQQPALLVQSGTLPGRGQKPTSLQPLPRRLQRG